MPDGARSRLPGHGGDPRLSQRRPSTSGSRRRGPERLRGRNGDRTSASGSGARCARTTATSGDAWNYFTARPGALARLPLGRGRHRRHLRRPAAALLRARAVERRDPILKERLFGLTNSEGNHGEDVKEYYFYLDSTPTHSYMKCLYKYPQRGVSRTSDLVATNRARGRSTSSSTSCSTPASSTTTATSTSSSSTPRPRPRTSCIRITVHNRGPEAATLHVLPTLWFRNTWSWARRRRAADAARPDGAGRRRRRADARRARRALAATATAPAQLLFTENETNTRAALRGRRTHARTSRTASTTTSSHGARDAVNPARHGHQGGGPLRARRSPAGESATVRLRLTARAPTSSTRRRSARLRRSVRRAASARPTSSTRRSSRRRSAPTQRSVHAPGAAPGMLWTQAVLLLRRRRAGCDEHGVDPLPTAGASDVRNARLVPHAQRATSSRCPTSGSTRGSRRGTSRSTASPLALVDPDFAKEQLELMLRERYLHPNGQIPAYEWNFGDVNPPVHAWATLFVYQHRAETHAARATATFLRARLPQAAAELHLVGQPQGPPTAATSSRAASSASTTSASSTAARRCRPAATSSRPTARRGWRSTARTCCEIALELARHDPAYEDMALKFVEHFVWIADAMNRPAATRRAVGRGGRLLLRRAAAARRQRRSGSRCARWSACCRCARRPCSTRDVLEPLPRGSWSASQAFVEHQPELCRRWPTLRRRRARRAGGCCRSSTRRGCGGSSRACSTRTEFLGAARHPRALALPPRAAVRVRRRAARSTEVDYLPAESDTGMFGGNSNWRGPVWFPMNLRHPARAAAAATRYYGDDFTVECPTGSGQRDEPVRGRARDRRPPDRASFTARRATGAGRCYGGTEKFQSDPHWRDLLLFHEYFHGDNGAGLGASHQTGWTGTVALLFPLHRTRCAVQPGADRRRRRADARAVRLPSPPDRSTRSTPRSGCSDLGRERGRAARARRGARRRVGRARGAAGRRRLADGRLAAQPGGPADRAGATRRWTRPTAPRCPTCAPEDVIGSPYCVRDYVVDERFGGAGGAGRGARAARRAAACG